MAKRFNRRSSLWLFFIKWTQLSLLLIGCGFARLIYNIWAKCCHANCNEWWKCRRRWWQLNSSYIYCLFFDWNSLWLTTNFSATSHELFRHLRSCPQNFPKYLVFLFSKTRVMTIFWQGKWKHVSRNKTSEIHLPSGSNVVVSVVVSVKNKHNHIFLLNWLTESQSPDGEKNRTL